MTYPNGRVASFYRIIAERDIPLHGVKAGDLGGYVSHENTLSQDGECWVGGTARVESGEWTYESNIAGNALITGHSMISSSTIWGNAILDGNTQCYSSTISDDTFIDGDIQISESVISGKIKILGTTTIIDSAFQGSGLLDGKVTINKAKLIGDMQFVGEITMEAGANLTGNCRIFGDVVTPPNLTAKNYIFGNMPASLIENKDDPAALRNGFSSPAIDTIHIRNLAEKQRNDNGSRLSKNRTEHDFDNDNLFDDGLPYDSSDLINGQQKAIFRRHDSQNQRLSSAESFQPVVNMEEYIQTILDIESEYESYTTDIVKLIKYPAMVDATIPAIHDFMSTLKKAKRAVKNLSNTLPALADELESKYCLAENVALTTSTTHLDDKQRSSLKTANQMLKIACDDEANENEKRSGFKAGLKALDGVLAIPEKAIDNLRERVGLLELEA